MNSMKAYALYLLARRDYSVKELRSKLVVWSQNHAGAQQHEITAVLEYLQHQDLLSDRRFIDSYIRSKGDKYGPSRLLYELSAKVDDLALVQQMVHSCCNDEVETAYRIWAKRFNFTEDVKQRSRQIRFLLYRGFNNTVIRKVLSLARERSDAQN